MSLFIVALESEASSHSVSEKLVAKGIQHHQVSSLTYAVSYEGLSADLAKDVGVDVDGKAAGAVFVLGSGYAGFADPGLWEWLRNNAT